MSCGDIFQEYLGSKMNKICIFINTGKKMYYKWGFSS